MKKTLLLACLGGILLLGSLVSGCIGFTPDWEPSWKTGWVHEKKHFSSFFQDMGEIHRFIDRHLFNFDESDPSRY
jgi:hypothetical protein